MATVLTEIALLAFCWYLTGRHLSRVPLLSLSWRILLAGLVMGAALYPLMHVTGLMVVVAIAAGALVYGLALLLMGGLDSDEIQLVRRAVRL